MLMMCMRFWALRRCLHNIGLLFMLNRVFGSATENGSERECYSFDNAETAHASSPLLSSRTKNCTELWAREERIGFIIV